MKLASRLCGAVLAAALFFGSSANAATIVIGHINLSFYEATAALYKHALERSGYNVVLKSGSHSVMYPLLADGEFDLFVAAWLPNTHKQYWEEYGENLSMVTPVYTDAKLFWAVPDYVPESAVKSVADLAKPGVAEKMQKTRLSEVYPEFPGKVA